MLHVTPESLLEDQPTFDSECNLVITADARIDNRSELMRKLGWKESPAASTTDVNLILAAYKKWGVSCPEHLLGAFAFAIWDGPEQRLFCARDHIGIKPFYYHFSNGLFVFGSEVRALFSVDDVPTEINEKRIADYLAHVGEDEKSTFYRDIQRLPPAHTLTVTRDARGEPKRYWTLDHSHRVEYQSDAEYEAHFLELFTKAIRCRLRTLSSPSVMVSGGLDSSSVTCIARDLLGATEQTPLQAFTATFPSLPEHERQRCDERAYIDELQAQGGLDVHLVRVDELSPLADLDSVVKIQSGPPFLCNYYIHSAVYQAVRQQNVRVIIDGNGGDDAVSYGFGYLGELAYEGRWPQLRDEITQLAGRTGATPSEFVRGTADRALRLRADQQPFQFISSDIWALQKELSVRPWDLLKQHFIKPRVPETLYRVWRKTRGLSSRPEAWSLLSDDLIERTDYYDRFRHLKGVYDVQQLDANRSHWLSIHAGAGVTSVGLEGIDSLAAAYGVERRHPFFDVRLLQFCVALPPEQKLRQGWTRSILRRAMKGTLPESIRKRTDKADLSPNFIRNLQRFESDRIERLFTEYRTHLEPYLDIATMHRARQQGDSVALWHALTLAEWLNQHEGEVSSIPASSYANGMQAAAAVL
jgi:asparagine synthase (glutamine-hydrolysing)